MQSTTNHRSVQLPSFCSSKPVALGCLARFTEHELRTSRQRYLAVAAQTHARRRRLINAALSVLIGLSFVVAGYTLHREQQMQQMEQQP
jgi:hypothetical protein